MKYDHIVWDWNGTLLDDLWLCIESINSVLESRDMKKVDEISYREIFTFPVIKYYEQLGFDFKEEKFPIPGFLDYYRKHFKKCFLHKNSNLVLRKNKMNGLSQSILSAGKQSSLLSWVKSHNIENYFNDLIGVENDNADGKIEAGLNWISHSDIPKHKILLIGDTIHDSDVAKEMGVDCVLVSIGHVSQERLKSAGPPVLEGLLSVLSYIEKY
jgi:phosphoglycolate phosphatase